MSLGLIAGIGAGIGALGNLVSSVMNYASQKETNKTNVEMNEANNALQRELTQQSNSANAIEAQKNRDWQEQMSNTSHQREMADLQAAGINPILAGTSGASIGTGGQATLSTPNTNASKIASPQLDLSGLSSSINSMTNLMLVSSMLKGSTAQTQSTIKGRLGNVLVTNKLSNNSAKTQTKSPLKNKKILNMTEKEFRELMDYNWIEN